MPQDDELDVQIAAETLSNLWKSGPNARTRAVAATATQVARSSSQLFNRVSSHPLMSIPARMYRNSKSYSTRSAIKLRRMIARRRLKANTPSSNKNNVQKRWKQLMMSAGLASLSRESRQRMRYCLHMLRLATESLSVKVSQLQDIIEEEKLNLKTKSRRKSRNSIGATVSALKRDIVITIYKAIAVVSNVAGNALPEPARRHVRNYIMKIPSRWAANVLDKMDDEKRRNGDDVRYEIDERGKKEQSETMNKQELNKEFIKESASNDSKLKKTASNDSKSELNAEIDTETNINDQGKSLTEEEVNIRRVEVETGSRVLTLAQESLESFDHIIGIIGDILERAEIWVYRGKSDEKTPSQNIAITESESEYNTADEYEERDENEVTSDLLEMEEDEVK